MRRDSKKQNKTKQNTDTSILRDSVGLSLSEGETTQVRQNDRLGDEGRRETIKHWRKKSGGEEDGDTGWLQEDKDGTQASQRRE